MTILSRIEEFVKRWEQESRCYLSIFFTDFVDNLKIFPLTSFSKVPIKNFALKTFYETGDLLASIRNANFDADKNYNIGIVTGLSNLIVFDFDEPHLFDEFEDLCKKIQLPKTLVVKTRRGFHAYYIADFQTIVSRKMKLNGIDVLMGNSYVVSPGSKVRSGDSYFEYTVVSSTSPVIISESVLKTILRHFSSGRDNEASSCGITSPPVVRKPINSTRSLSGISGVEGRLLDGKQLLELHKLLEPFYRPGFRQQLCLFIAGWAKKAGVAEKSIINLFTTFVDEEIDKRIEAIRRTYVKDEHEVRGYSGVQELFEGIISDKNLVITVLRDIENILGSSPYNDSIVEVLDFDKKIFAVADRQSLIVTLARWDRKKGLLVNTKKILDACPIEVSVIESKTSRTKFEIVFRSKVRKPFSVGPATIEEIVEILTAEGLLYHKNYARDALFAVINGFIYRNKASISVERTPGFWFEGGVITAIDYETSLPKQSELRKALLLLDDLVSVWFAHAKERFVTFLKASLLSPFFYVYKCQGKWKRWCFLFGDGGTGKSTMAEVVLSIWGKSDPSHIKTGTSIDTPARLAYIISRDTFPVLINEPGGVLVKDDLIEMLKVAIEGSVIRGRVSKMGMYEETIAFAPIIFASNKFIPRDEALLRRFYVFQFTYGERVLHRKDEFDEIRKRFCELSALGKWLANYIVTNNVLLEDHIAFAEVLLREAYHFAGLKAPDWLMINESNLPEMQDLQEILTENIRNFIMEKINDAVRNSSMSLRERCAMVFKNQLLAYMRLNSRREVIITSGILDDLRKRIGIMKNLKSLAEVLQWEWRPQVQVGSTKMSAVVVHYDEFLKFMEVEK